MLMWRCLAIVVALAACSKTEQAKPSNGSGSAGSGSAPAAVANSVNVVVNDKVVATLGVDKLDKYPQLSSLVPNEAARMGSWTSVTVKGASGKPIEISRPGDKYRDQVLVLFVADGKPAFGIFDPVELAKRGSPGMRESGVTEIKIVADTSGGRGQNESGSGANSDPTKLVVSIKSAKGEVKLTGEQILKIDRVEMPGGDGDAKGWKLTAFLAAANITTYEKLILTDDTGKTNLSIDKSEFDDKTSIPFVKLNKQGQLRVRMYVQKGTGWQSTKDLRGLAAIEVK